MVNGVGSRFSSQVREFKRKYQHMRNAGMEEAQAGIKTARINTIILTCADDTTLMADNKEKLKSLPLEKHIFRSGSNT